MKQEMMDDTVDDVLGDEEDDEERCETTDLACLIVPCCLANMPRCHTLSCVHACRLARVWVTLCSLYLLSCSEMLVGQVLDELGLSLTGELAAIPTAAMPAAEAVGPEADLQVKAVQQLCQATYHCKGRVAHARALCLQARLEQLRKD